MPANLLSLAAVLEGLGCRVESARSGDEALRLLLREPFAVMLLDVRMPSMDGFAVARYVRMHSQTRDLPIIFLTADTNDPDENQRRAYACGAVDFLLKPINRDALRSKVKVFVELDTQRRELADANDRLQVANAKLLALADAEATSSSVLRQAHDDLGIAYRELRETQVQMSEMTNETTAHGLLDGFPVVERAVRADPVAYVTSRIELAQSSLARLRDRKLLTHQGEAEVRKIKKLLGEVALELKRLRSSSRKSVASDS